MALMGGPRHIDHGAEDLDRDADEAADRWVRYGDRAWGE